jgi:hypothetical protein
MQLSRDELLLILAAFDFKEFTDLSQRLETFLSTNRDEVSFIVTGKEGLAAKIETVLERWLLSDEQREEGN